MSLRSALLSAAALALLAGGCGTETDPSAAPAAAEARSGQIEPPLVQPAEFDLSDYEGQVVLLNFWATWCAPCRVEMPDLVELQRELGADGLQIIGVAVDQQGRAALKPYLKQQPINYPIVVDSTSQIGESYGGVYRLPTTLVIGPDGTVHDRIIGRVRPESLHAYVENLLASSDISS